MIRFNDDTWKWLTFLDHPVQLLLTGVDAADLHGAGAENGETKTTRASSDNHLLPPQQ